MVNDRLTKKCVNINIKFKQISSQFCVNMKVLSNRFGTTLSPKLESSGCRKYYKKIDIICKLILLRI